MTCENCTEDHYYEMTLSSQSLSDLDEIAQQISYETNDVSYDGITERCVHGDVSECRVCEYI